MIRIFKNHLEYNSVRLSLPIKTRFIGLDPRSKYPQYQEIFEIVPPDIGFGINDGIFENSLGGASFL